MNDLTGRIKFARDSGATYRSGLYWAALGILVLALVGVGGCSHSATGLYVAKSPHGLARLQLVEAPEQHLIGQLDLVGYNADGKWIGQTLAVEGSRDGSAVSLTMKSPGVSLDALLASGEFSWGTLKLTGNFGGRIKMIEFKSSDDSQYQADLRTLREAAQALSTQREAEARKLAAEQEAAARARMLAEQLAEHDRKITAWASNVEQLVVRLKTFEGQADLHLGRWPHTESAISAATVDMQRKLDEIRTISGPFSSERRSPLIYAMHQEALATDQTNSDVTELRNTFYENIVPLVAQARSTISDCGAQNNLRDVSSHAEANQACTDIKLELAKIEPRYKAVAAGLDHLAKLYAVQHQQQVSILSAANEGR